MGRDAELARLVEGLSAPDRPRGVALFGEAGVGKSRLVAEVVAARRADDVAVEWVRATEAARRIPLGSFAHLLAADDEAHRRDDLLHLALARLVARAGGPGFLLAVDDAHLLDDVSVALLHLAVTQSSVRVLVSVRTGEPLPAGLGALWKDEHLDRIDVEPLARGATDDLVLAVLGDGVPASLLDRIWRLSRGNALFVRELVAVAAERRAGGGSGPVALSEGRQDRLRELVEERLRLLDADARAALEVVAVGEQVPLEAVERLAAADHVADLERRGLVEVVDAGPGGGGPGMAGPGAPAAGAVRVTHPLYGEVLAAGLPRLRRRAILRDLARAAEGLDGVDRLRVATWQLESGEPGDPDQLLLLAREALGRLDHRLAERQARAAGGGVRAGPADDGVVERADAGLVVGEALSGQGRLEDAQAVLAALRPTDPELVARVAIARASELFLHLDRSSEAYAVLAEADDALAGEPAWQAECRSVRAQMLMFSMRLAEAGALADELLASPDAPGSARVRAVTVAVTTWGAAGRVDDAVGLVDDGLYASARRHRREVPYGDVQLRMARFQALYWAGRFRDLDDFTAADLGLDIGHPPPSLGGILAGFRGGALLVRGRARQALAELQRSSRTLAESDWFGQRPLAEAMRARAAVFAGELDVAAEALDAADQAFRADPQRAARTLPYIELSRAWRQAADGDAAGAAQSCLNLAMVMEHTAKPLAVELLHAAVRMGRAAEARPGLERLAAAVDGPVAPVAARHAAARADADPAALAAVAAELEAIGADLLAAEAHRSAANLYRRQGLGAAAATAARRVEELLARCGRPSSPGLEPVVTAGEELTERERHVATLAARGRTSPEIAAELFLSVRTVDTHLHRIYRKLQVEGRRQLAAALGVDAGPDGGRAT